MQALDAYPARAVGGSCFVTKDYDTSNGKRVVSLDIDLSNMPTHGLLCLSEEAVRQMNVCLGWEADVHGAERLAALRAELTECQDANTKLRAALDAVLVAQEAVAPPAAVVVADETPADVADEPATTPRKRAAKKPS